MISVNEAKDIVRKNTGPLTPVTVPLRRATGLTLAEDVYAEIDIPAFNQSSMDGYALSFNDYFPGSLLEIAGEVPAGMQKSFTDLTGKAVRIFTGAPVPEGADTVVMQEKVTVQDKGILIIDTLLKKGDNVRSKGAEIQSGALALPAGSLLSPAAIGFLAGTGIAQAKVFPRPKVAMIVTGKELQQPGQPLLPGQVYESNSLTIQSALSQLHITDVNIILVDDDLPELQKVLENALKHADLVLLTGGISVGEYDFVLKATELCEVEKLFHRIKQRPGMPLYFGKKEKTLVFGLPGNPSSVLTCFYEYVIPALQEMTFYKDIIKIHKMPLILPYSKKPGLTHFLKGICKENTVAPLDAQESFRLSSFAKANCLICLAEESEEFKKGDLVEVHILPL